MGDGGEKRVVGKQIKKGSKRRLATDWTRQLRK